MKNKNSYILKVSCPGRVGIVAALGNFMSDRGCFIKELHQFDDQETGRFFSTIEFVFEGDRTFTVDQMKAAFEVTAMSFDMEWEIHDASERAKVLIMVSKYDHCLRDLLYRRATGELMIDITAIVSNHEDLREMAEREGIEFIHLPVTKETKPQQESRLLEIVRSTDTELVVLARYMQILSDTLSKELEGRCINIHHSFLPGFKGAKPYYQAYDRGVKLIGATAHYVTGDLDEGPIIEQMVERVDHAHDPKHLTQVGRDMEAQALARAVKYHVSHRVFQNGLRTVVF
ncbi:formyltetrahydrofolate deformylase [Cobetia marina]|uniref:Formyltetrahydrofolate deformylase n=1 Tax=Cobetia amphilecti TaxID=1055104 RepID=A0AAP4TYN8_9GAMM|nr:MULTISPECIES: formyltetrahydrofolate deformylase [Cobetia]TCJ25653.1 formyltetrahydrofolate deformylase [Halomonas sp. GDM18]KPM80393.1 formyltetrahydrofolate deformylase [Cobetia sp. UCD-24C]MBU3009675.1 formyltetrahydrofolate deformylase [Cobetia amphilecti]MDO6671381.1 formyltetrahydrofolate deformylase [Cobetia amphilecti]MDO6814147.1 formyltetrahydrofolate deformylase [Cobetia amphilecti]